MKKERRSGIIPVRVSATERAILGRGADSIDMSLSTFIRTSGLAAARRSTRPATVKVGDELLELADEKR